MKKILVIEDDVKIAQSLKQGLETEGYDVMTAVTGEDGFFLISTESFDVVVLDLMLPGRSGLEILAALRRRDAPDDSGDMPFSQEWPSVCLPKDLWPSF